RNARELWHEVEFEDRRVISGEARECRKAAVARPAEISGVPEDPARALEARVRALDAAATRRVTRHGLDLSRTEDNSGCKSDDSGPSAKAAGRARVSRVRDVRDRDPAADQHIREGRRRRAVVHVAD